MPVIYSILVVWTLYKHKLKGKTCSGKLMNIVTTDTTLGPSLEVREKLLKRDIGAGIIKAISIKPQDEAAICAVVAKYGRLVTVEGWQCRSRLLCARATDKVRE